MNKISIVIIVIGLISVNLELLAIVTMFGIVSDTWQFSMISLIVGIAMFTIAIVVVLKRLELDRIPSQKLFRKKKQSKKSARKKIPLKNLAMDN